MSGWYLRTAPEGVVFKVRVVPRSGRNELAGWHGDAIRVRLTAPPVEGAANEACVAFWAELLGVARGRVSIVAGVSSRDKLVRVSGVDEAAVRAAVAMRGAPAP